MASLNNPFSSFCLWSFCGVVALSILLWPVAAAANNDDEATASGRAPGWPNITASVAMRDPSDRPATHSAKPWALAATTNHADIGGEPKRLVLSMAAEVAPRTSLLVERSRVSALSEPTVPSLNTGPITKVGVEFRPVSAAAALSPVGALRVQMSDNSSLSLRPRHGGLLMSWRSQF